VSRERAKLDEWAQELAPSTDLRRWFNHDPGFSQFRTRYRKELAGHADELNALRERAAKGAVTIVYGARDEQHNNAVVLAELLRSGRGGASGGTTT
jgi:uncharacterized protein YeaO (DUF488 family)